PGLGPPTEHAPRSHPVKAPAPQDANPGQLCWRHPTGAFTGQPVSGRSSPATVTAKTRPVFAAEQNPTHDTNVAYATIGGIDAWLEPLKGRSSSGTPARKLRWMATRHMQMGTEGAAMRTLRGWRPPTIVIRVGIGVVMAAVLSVAVVAETTAASSAGRDHGRS